MSQDITIIKSQLGIAYERIQAETGQWKQEFAHWCDLPLLAPNRHSLHLTWAKYAERADYRNLRWAWRGVMTNTITADDMESLENVSLQLGLKHDQVTVIAQGTAFDGLTLHGPFRGVSDAAAWAEQHAMGNWEAVYVDPI